jgi:tetratricopeptide (TPR) repeat protein
LPVRLGVESGQCFLFGLEYSNGLVEPGELEYVPIVLVESDCGQRLAVSIGSYETAASLCRPDDLARIEAKLGGVHLRRGEWEVAASHFDAALAGVTGRGDLALRSSLHTDLSLTAHRSGDADRAQGEAALALKLAEEAGDPRSVAQAHNILGILARSRGDLPAARHHLALSLQISEDMDDSASQVAALNNLALAKWGLGEIEDAIALAERALSICSALGDRHREAALHNSLSDLLHASGRPDAAIAHLKQAVAIFAEIGEDAGAMQPEIWKLVEW